MAYFDYVANLKLGKTDEPGAGASGPDDTGKKPKRTATARVGEVASQYEDEAKKAAHEIQSEIGNLHMKGKVRTWDMSRELKRVGRFDDQQTGAYDAGFFRDVIGATTQLKAQRPDLSKEFDKIASVAERGLGALARRDAMLGAPLPEEERRGYAAEAGAIYGEAERRLGAAEHREMERTGEPSAVGPEAARLREEAGRAALQESRMRQFAAGNFSDALKDTFDDDEWDVWFAQYKKQVEEGAVPRLVDENGNPARTSVPQVDFVRYLRAYGAQGGFGVLASLSRVYRDLKARDTTAEGKFPKDIGEKAEVPLPPGVAATTLRKTQSEKISEGLQQVFETDRMRDRPSVWTFVILALAAGIEGALKVYLRAGGWSASQSGVAQFVRELHMRDERRRNREEEGRVREREYRLRAADLAMRGERESRAASYDYARIEHLMSRMQASEGAQKDRLAGQAYDKVKDQIGVLSTEIDDAQRVIDSVESPAAEKQAARARRDEAVAQRKRLFDVLRALGPQFEFEDEAETGEEEQ